MTKPRTTDDWVIIPYIRIGPIRFGMTRDEVRTVLATRARPFRKSPSSISETDAFDALRVHVYYDANDRCHFVELYRSGRPGGPELEGRGFLDRPYDRALAWFRERDPHLETDGCGLRSYRYGVTLFTESAERDPSLPIEGLGAFARGYFPPKP